MAGREARTARWRSTSRWEARDSLANDELQDRFSKATPGRPAQPFAIKWQQSGGELIFPESQVSEEGYYEATLAGTPVAGTLHHVVARVGDVVLDSATLPMLAGRAEELILSHPDGVVWEGGMIPSQGWIPADGTTEIELTVKALDGQGNPVRDDTPVHCSVDAPEEGTEAGYGEIIDGTEDQLTVDGTATCRYRAGRVFRIENVTSEVDGIETQIPIGNLALEPGISVECRGA